MGMNKPGHMFLHTWTSVCPCDHHANVRASALDQFGWQSQGDEKDGKKTSAPERLDATIARSSAVDVLAVWRNTMDGVSFYADDYDT